VGGWATNYCSGALNRHTLELKLVIFLMRADPKPVIMTLPLASDGAVAPAYFNCVNLAFLGETEGGMPRVCLEQRELFVR
jgi:hypothetical protein